MQFSIYLLHLIDYDDFMKDTFEILESMIYNNFNQSELKHFLDNVFKLFVPIEIFRN
jgi:hypothetical protein